jgi:hypothetical protein
MQTFISTICSAEASASTILPMARLTPPTTGGAAQLVPVAQAAPASKAPASRGHRGSIIPWCRSARSREGSAEWRMLLDCGMSLKDTAECFKLEVDTVVRLVFEYQRSLASRPRQMGS